MATNPPPKKEKLTPVGFRCNDEVYNYLQAKAVELSQKFLLDPRTGQYVIDPTTNKPKKIVDKPKKEKTYNQGFKNNESVSAQKPVMSNDFNTTSNTIPTFGQPSVSTGTGVVPSDTDFLPRQQGFMPNSIANLLAWTLD